MPVSFGVLLVMLGVALLVSLSASAVLYRNALRSDAESRALERRLSKELTQLRAASAGLQAQLELRAQDVALQARELERVNAELEGMRGCGFETRSARARRLERAGR